MTAFVAPLLEYSRDRSIKRYARGHVSDVSSTGTHRYYHSLHPLARYVGHYVTMSQASHQNIEVPDPGPDTGTFFYRMASHRYSNLPK